jgi:hypothetical protein
VYHVADDNHHQVFLVSLTRRQLRSPKYTLLETCDTLPNDAERTTVTDHKNFVYCHGSQPNTLAQPSPMTVKDSIHANDQWAIRKLHYKENGKNIAQALIQGNAIAVWDGSYKDQFGTPGFFI